MVGYENDCGVEKGQLSTLQASTAWAMARPRAAPANGQTGRQFASSPLPRDYLAMLVDIFMGTERFVLGMGRQLHLCRVPLSALLVDSLPRELPSSDL